MLRTSKGERLASLILPLASTVASLLTCDWSKRLPARTVYIKLHLRLLFPGSAEANGDGGPRGREHRRGDVLNIGSAVWSHAASLNPITFRFC